LHVWQVRANFRPEFVNRIDEYIVFEGLKREQIKKIVRIQAKRVAERLAAKKIALELNESAVDYLVVRHPQAAVPEKESDPKP
jgi:ATP-dependent Clp protease ATP-binding subunit ClpB